MKKAIYFVSLLVAAAAMLMLSMPVFASEMDRRIESTARQSYVFQTYLQVDNKNIKIESNDGDVILTGFVTDNVNKSLVRETIAGLPGVKSVDNRLVVRGESSTINSDAWISDKVKSTLLFHRSVNSYTTAVSVKDGIVTLRGAALSEAQKDLTAEYAKDVEGVKGVNNEMTLANTANKTQTVGKIIDDASITAQVKMTLLYHRSTSAINTKVETNDGVVTIYGKAGSTAEKELAGKFANDVNGVKGIKNRMTIE